MNQRSRQESAAVPDLVEPIVGYRLWRWTARDGLLSPVHPLRWPALRAVEARCAPSERALAGLDHRAELPPHPSSVPAEDCLCGIYAARTLPACDATQLVFGADFLVVGSVWLWGRVIEAERGFRAQFAYPKTLALIASSWKPRRPSRRPLRQRLFGQAIGDLRSYGVSLSVLPCWGSLADWPEARGALPVPGTASLLWP